MSCVCFKVDSVIDICSDVMNLRSVSYECKCKLEEIKDDYKIEVRFEGYTGLRRLKLRNGIRLLAETCNCKSRGSGFPWHHTNSPQIVVKKYFLVLLILSSKNLFSNFSPMRTLFRSFPSIALRIPTAHNFTRD